jgi:hypothetical protein
MATSSDPAGFEATTRPLATRVVGWHWKWPVLLASGLLLTLLSAVLGVHAMIDEVSTVEGRIRDVGVGIRMRANIVLAVVSAYTLGTGLIGLARATQEFDKLQSVFRRGEREFVDFRSRLVPDARALAQAASAGGAIGAALQLSPYLFEANHQDHASLHSIPFMILLFILLGMMARITTSQSRVFYEVGREYIEVDLLDAEALSPFAGVGLMNAASWFIGSALASFLMVSGANPLLVALVIVATTGLGIAALIVPSRGIHWRLREEKRRELVRIREAIASERAALFAVADPPPEPPRMHALLAYEARIESVREWPFDTSTLGRFGFFLLIPLVSWIGGALVERAVDAALG